MRIIKSMLNWVIALILLIGSNIVEARHDYNKSGEILSSVTLTWQATKDAVKYEIVILKSAIVDEHNIIYRNSNIYTTGVNIKLGNINGHSVDGDNYYWSYRPLDYEGKVIGDFSLPRRINEGILNPKTPTPTAEYDKMTYSLMYPVYSWIPLMGENYYEVGIYRYDIEGEHYLRSLKATGYDIYDTVAHKQAGRYAYKVRAIDWAGTPTTDWSNPSYFTIEDRVKVAALGDSITHGGGVISVPPSYKIYNWETYSNVPVKNLGYSGDTTADMLNRFDSDVLAFSPKILVIMGGVNDYRSEIFGATTVRNLEAIKGKCEINGIIPIFLTITPMRPNLMWSRGISLPHNDWQHHHSYINNWVRSQRYYVDVSTVLSDIKGYLEAEYTTDGLHPDYMGKKYIGERVSEYLTQHFMHILNNQ